MNIFYLKNVNNIMKTISIKIELNTDLEKVISEDSRICSSAYRYCFNRLQDKKDPNFIYNDITEKFNLNTHILNSVLRYAQGLFKLNKDKKVYFGKFLKFKKGLITKEEYKKSKNFGILSNGQAYNRGNRLFSIDTENNKIIYKRSCKEHYDLIIKEKLSEKRKNILKTIQLMMSERKLPITFKLKNDIVYIHYDESIIESNKRFSKVFNNRILGIDLNPNYFGISIIEFDKYDNFKIIYKELIDITELQKKSRNKIHFELFQINHHILKLCKTWHVGKISIEDLKILHKTKFKNRKLNGICKNTFRYSFIKNHLKTLCNIFGVELIEVNAAYSSIIGNFSHGSDGCPDPIASSIEIARRSYKKFEKGWFQPHFISKDRLRQVLGNQWKKELEYGYNCWKKLAGIIKKSKLKYRFQLNPLNAVLSKNYLKKYIKIYIFY